jgi:N-acetylneuraminic acid mutarotase
MRGAAVGICLWVAGCGASSSDVPAEEADTGADTFVEPMDSDGVDTADSAPPPMDSAKADTGTEPRECVTGQYRCSGDHLEKCNESGFFDTVQTCGPGLCDAVSRECDECKPGTGKCSDTGATPSTCDASGRWKVLAACADPLPFCSAGTCVAATPGFHPLPVFASLQGRSEHTAVWDNALGEMIVWGGRGCSGSTVFCGDGARWDKKTNNWTMLPAAPIAARRSHTAVFTGSSMVIFGGYGGASPSGQLADGASYDPVTDKWTKLATGPTAREQHTAVWTGTEMIVWGGEAPSGVAHNDGMRWNPTSGAWTAMKVSPLSPRRATDAVWTGGKMIVWGGEGNTCPGKTAPTDIYGYCADGAAYDPATDTWTMLPAAPLDARARAGSVAAGGLAMFIHGVGQTIATVPPRDDGASYDPVANTWTKIVSAGDMILPPAKRYSGFVWYGAGKLYSWGGVNITGATFTYPTNGASYDPATAKWTAMPTGGPTGRHSGTVVWTGSEAILFGGRKGSTDYNDGKIYRP